MNWQARVVAGALALAVYAGPAWADDSTTVKSDLDAMRQRLADQDRKIRELQGTALTQDEMSANVERYLRVAPTNVLVGGGGDGSAGWPLGKKPFIKEGPNKLEIGFRNQVRYSAFLYSDKGIGTLADAGNPVRKNGTTILPPRDRSGFEIERMYIVLEGSVFCEDFTFKTELNFDSDNGLTGVERNYMYLDWKYTGEHHFRAGVDKVAFNYEENNSSAALAFVDRSIVTKAFDNGSFTNGVALWGYLGDPCECPKRFMYKIQAGNGEGEAIDIGGSYAGHHVISGGSGVKEIGAVRDIVKSRAIERTGVE